jgi:hypothetical protein
MRIRSRKDFAALLNEEPGIVAHSVQSGDRPTASPIVIGARFRMSVLGAARNPRLAEKKGTIVGSSRINSSVRVLFDGRKSPISLHRGYIEQVSSEAE